MLPKLTLIFIYIYIYIYIYVGNLLPEEKKQRAVYSTCAGTYFLTGGRFIYLASPKSGRWI